MSCTRLNFRQYNFHILGFCTKTIEGPMLKWRRLRSSAWQSGSELPNTISKYWTSLWLINCWGILNVVMARKKFPRDMISVPPSASLYNAVSLLIKVRSCKLWLGLHCLKNLKVKIDKICSNFQNKIHRLPVVDPENGNVLYILNQKPLLRCQISR